VFLGFLGRRRQRFFLIADVADLVEDKVSSVLGFDGEVGAGNPPPCAGQPDSSILEVYRQLLAEFDMNTVSSSRAVLTRLIRQQIHALVSTKKQQPLLIIDEASLLQLEVFAELHTLTQFEGDSKPWLPVILAGQNNLAENLLYLTAIPLASRALPGRTSRRSTGSEWNAMSTIISPLPA